jgi:hypothetical protein
MIRAATRAKAAHFRIDAHPVEPLCLITSNVILFGQVLKSAPHVRSVVELGCNIGLNLQALNRINKEFELCGYEIHERAARIAREVNVANIIGGTILNKLPTDKQYDLGL